MKVAVKYTTNFVNGLRVAGLVKDGLRRNGLYTEDMEEADIICAWGWKDDALKALKKDVWVLDRGYIGDRMAFTSIGVNGINRQGEFIQKQMPSDRWNKYFDDVYIEPYKKDNEGEYILITGQNHKDANTIGIDLKREYKRLYDECSRRGPTYFRPHPGAMGQLVTPDNISISTAPYLSAIRGAKYVVSFSSNSLIDALLMGTPVVSLDDRAMVWDITGHSLNDIRKPNRVDFIYNTMYRQWTPDEIASGEMFSFLLETRYK